MHLASAAATAQERRFKAETPNPRDGAGQREPGSGLRRRRGWGGSSAPERGPSGAGRSQETPNPHRGIRRRQRRRWGTSEPGRRCLCAERLRGGLPSTGSGSAPRRECKQAATIPCAGPAGRRHPALRGAFTAPLESTEKSALRRLSSLLPARHPPPRQRRQNAAHPHATGSAQLYIYIYIFKMPSSANTWCAIDAPTPPNTLISQRMSGEGSRETPSSTGL